MYKERFRPGLAPGSLQGGLEWQEIIEGGPTHKKILPKIPSSVVNDSPIIANPNQTDNKKGE
jgi:hypothetical protein